MPTFRLQTLLEKVQGQLLLGSVCGQHQTEVFDMQEGHVPAYW